MSDNNIDRVKAVQDLFPTNGPHTAEQVIAAADAIAELWRYLGHAFQGYAAKIDALEDLSEAYRFVGNLAVAEHRSANILERLVHWAHYVGARSVGTDAYGISDPDGSIDQIESLMNRVGKHLAKAATSHLEADTALNRAHSQLSFVWTNQDDD